MLAKVPVLAACRHAPEQVNTHICLKKTKPNQKQNSQARNELLIFSQMRESRIFCARNHFYTWTKTDKHVSCVNT